MNVLITGGGCEEPIDGVRCIANFSTGATAARIARALAGAGHSVTALFSQRSLAAGGAAANLGLAAEPGSSSDQGPASGTIEARSFRSFADLRAALEKSLAERPYGLVVHAAAVSDYGVDSVAVDGDCRPGGASLKIDSDRSVSIRLRPHPKLVDSIKALALDEKCILAAFKLTNGAGEDAREEAARILLARSGADYVISNDLSEISGSEHPFRAFAPAQKAEAANAGSGRAVKPKIVTSGVTKEELALFFIALANGGKPS